MPGLAAGALFQIVVGAPGPDVETGIVLERTTTGYRILTANLFTGEIEESETSAQLHGGINWPGQFREADAERLRAEYEKRLQR